ncbi:hypothetical protein J437_LFUL011485 [Ladona fulva]|uniref:Uncharacterized protein n=1 Tax=Ladona fulva TaxID=123851 RepID=A0A8K0KCG6_LADFU|nr:hypothetical protein J437_LFUL011485 [Ladona fulva]
MVDSGSQVSAISSAAVRRLNLPVSPSISQFTFRVVSNHSQATGGLCCFVAFANSQFIAGEEYQGCSLPHLTSKLPSVPLPSFIRNSISHLHISDPEFDKPDSRPRLKASYCQFLKVYENLGHISRAASLRIYYLLQYGVHKSTPQGPNLRVVFDVSTRSSNGNSTMYCFRVPAPEHRGFQHILWRDDSTHTLQQLGLNAVTYEIVSAPYLDIHTLHQLVHDKGETSPLA